MMCLTHLGRVVIPATRPFGAKTMLVPVLPADHRRTFSAAIALQFASLRESPLQWTDATTNHQAALGRGGEPLNTTSMADLQRDWDVRVLTYRQLKPKTQIPLSDTYLIDVREPREVQLGKIPSAVNLPLSMLPESLHLNQEAFREKHGFEKPKPDQELIFYCRSGNRSTKACDVAFINGYTNIYNYKGSWIDWICKET